MKLKKIIFTTLGLVVLLMASCSSDDAPTVTKIERKSTILSPQEMTIAKSQYDFPVQLLSSAYKMDSNKNVIISPLSSAMVMGMMANAFDKEDRSEILNVLGLTDNELSTYDSYVKNLIQQLPSLDSQTLFTINNGFWFANDLEISDAYKEIMNNYYFSELSSFEIFDLNTINDINQWVSQKTKGGIPEILYENDASDQIKAAWVNALYFKGSWTQKFDKTRTEPKPFYGNFPEEIPTGEVDMMAGYDFRYYHELYPNGNDDDKKEAIKTVMLPYGNESFIFTAVQPSENNPDIDATLRALTSDYWNTIDMMISDSKSPGDIHVYLPKLNLEFRTDLIPAFRNMGVNKMFDHISAEEALGLSDFFINLFRQGVSFEMDEEGSEIKVATVATGGFTSDLPTEILEVNLNRPFIYFVRERTTGAVLLAGIFTNPE